MITQLSDQYSDAAFETAALALFRWQSVHCEVYRRWLEITRIQPDSVRKLREIPFLPIEAFRAHRVISNDCESDLVFESSGTGNDIRSRHFVCRPELYRESILRGFELAYGSVKEYEFFVLLPSYLERSNASLVHMVRLLMEASGQAEEHFYLNQHAELSSAMSGTEAGRRPFLIGVSFALLDLADSGIRIPADSIVCETGGMKGRRREMIREELHDKLRSAFGLELIHSEYGMTELLSQAWRFSESGFECPPWMRISLVELDDPGVPVKTGRSGRVRVIDLANAWSCAFIQTSDIGREISPGKFEILGRTDQSEARGCNLMVSDL